MALISCPDCKKPISAEAQTCPKCGRPITDEDRKKTLPGCGKWFLWIFCVSVVFTAAVSMCSGGSAAFDAWCAYERDYQDYVKQAHRTLGGLPSESLGRGDTLLIEHKTPLAPRPGTHGLTAAEVEGLIDQIAQMHPGLQVTIVQRIATESGGLWYRVRVPNGIEGFIFSPALSWYDTMERMDIHEAKLRAWLAPFQAHLEERHFTSKGLSKRELDTKALAEGWLRKCMERK